MTNADNPNYGRIPSFSLRGSRMGERYHKLMEQHGAKYTLDFPLGFAPATIAADALIDLPQLFGRQAPLVVEIGPGSGEQLVHGAKLHPDWDFLAFEAWGPGVARCVQHALAENVTNVRIAELDAAQALPIIFGSQLAPAISADHAKSRRQYFAHEVWTFFPDPWRKKRHRKRRIVCPSFAQIVASILPAGGVWRLATDWDNYAWQMRDVLFESPWFDLQYQGENIDQADAGIYQGGFAPRFPQRVCTRFEARGVEAGRSIHDLVAVRNHTPVLAVAVPEDPWISAAARGVNVPAAAGGARPPSSRRGFFRAKASETATAASTASDFTVAQKAPPASADTAQTQKKQKTQTKLGDT